MNGGFGFQDFMRNLAAGYGQGSQQAASAMSNLVGSIRQDQQMKAKQAHDDAQAQLTRDQSERHFGANQELQGAMAGLRRTPVLTPQDQAAQRVVESPARGRDLGMHVPAVIPGSGALPFVLGQMETQHAMEDPANAGALQGPPGESEGAQWERMRGQAWNGGQPTGESEWTRDPSLAKPVAPKNTGKAPATALSQKEVHAFRIRAASEIPRPKSDPELVVMLQAARDQGDQDFAAALEQELRKGEANRQNEYMGKVDAKTRSLMQEYAQGGVEGSGFIQDYLDRTGGGGQPDHQAMQDAQSFGYSGMAPDQTDAEIKRLGGQEMDPYAPNMPLGAGPAAVFRPGAQGPPQDPRLPMRGQYQDGGLQNRGAAGQLSAPQQPQQMRQPGGPPASAQVTPDYPTQQILKMLLSQQQQQLPDLSNMQTAAPQTQAPPPARPPVPAILRDMSYGGSEPVPGRGQPPAAPQAPALDHPPGQTWPWADKVDKGISSWLFDDKDTGLLGPSKRHESWYPPDFDHSFAGLGVPEGTPGIEKTPNGGFMMSERRPEQPERPWDLRAADSLRNGIKKGWDGAIGKILGGSQPTSADEGQGGVPNANEKGAFDPQSDMMSGGGYHIASQKETIQAGNARLTPRAGKAYLDVFNDPTLTPQDKAALDKPASSYRTVMQQNELAAERAKGDFHRIARNKDGSVVPAPFVNEGDHQLGPGHLSGEALDLPRDLSPAARKALMMRGWKPTKGDDVHWVYKP